MWLDGRSSFRAAAFRPHVAVLALCLSLGMTLPAAAQLPTVELQALSQAVAQIGSSIDLQPSGSHTDELTQLLFSSVGVTATQHFEPLRPLSDTPKGTGRFKVTLDASAPPGLCEVRSLGRFGVSNPRRLLLSQKPVVVAGSDHSHAAIATQLPDDKIVVARCQPRQRNFYSYRLAAGQSLRCVVYAQQLDSRAIPIVVLYGPGPDRRELSRGRAIADWPAEVSCTLEEEGEVLVVVQDAIYLGGPEYHYALESCVGSPESPPPPLELDQLLRPRIDQRDRSQLPLEGLAVGSQHSGEPNAEPSEQLPLRVQGAFSQDRSPRHHHFAAAKGQSLWIEVNSQGLGELTDPRLVLYRIVPAAAEVAATPAEATPPETAQTVEATQQLVEQDDPPALGDAGLRISFRDPQFAWTAPEDGRYRIELQDNESGARPNEQMNYLLTIGPLHPDYQLLAYPPFPSNNASQSRPTAINLIRGGTQSIRVLVLRRGGFSDPISLAIDGLPEGVTATEAVLHPAQQEVVLTLQSTETAAAWAGPITIVGRAAGEGVTPNVAVPATIVWPTIPTRNAVQSRTSRDLILCVNPHDTAPLSVELGNGSVLEVKQGEKLPVPIRVTRRAGGTAACLLRPQNLLAKVTLAELTIAADQTEATAELVVAEDAAVGEFTFWMQNETKVKWRENPQALERSEAYFAQLTAALGETTEASAKAALEDAIKNTAAEVELLKKSTAEKELTVWFPTTTQRIRVIGK